MSEHHTSSAGHNTAASPAADPNHIREETRVVQDPAVSRAVEQQVSRLWEAVSYDPRVRRNGASDQYVARAESSSPMSSSNARLQIAGLSYGRPVAAMTENQTRYNLDGTNGGSNKKSVDFGVPTGDGSYRFTRVSDIVDLGRGHRQQEVEEITVGPDGTITALRTVDQETNQGYTSSTTNIAPEHIADVVGSMASNIASALEQYTPDGAHSGQTW